MTGGKCSERAKWSWKRSKLQSAKWRRRNSVGGFFKKRKKGKKGRREEKRRKKKTRASCDEDRPGVRGVEGRGSSEGRGHRRVVICVCEPLVTSQVQTGRKWASWSVSAALQSAWSCVDALATGKCGMRTQMSSVNRQKWEGKWFNGHAAVCVGC